MKKKTILVTGLHGFTGSRFAQMSESLFNLIDLNRKGKKLNFKNVIAQVTADVTNKEQLLKSLDKYNFDLVLHLAAKTHIDRCEKDKVQGRKSETWRVNVDGTKNIATLCRKFGKYLIFLSTECVFDGERGNYTEKDIPHPKNWYGETKFRAEQQVLESGAKASILRSVFAFGHPDPFPNDIFQVMKSVWKKGQTVKAVSDQKISFTFIDNLIQTIQILINRQPTGIYHFAGSEFLSPYEFAKRIKKEIGIPQASITPVTLNEYFGWRSRLRLKNATLSSKKIIKKYGDELIL